MTPPLLLASLLACISGDPAPLPATTLVEAPSSGKMVKVPGVLGYLATPAGEGPWPGTLLLVQELDEGTKGEALRLAAEGSRVLTVGPESDLDRGRAYLAALPGCSGVQVVCRRPACPE